jgi:hypothetical protein
MPINQSGVTALSILSFLILARVGIIALLILYIIFAFIIAKQVMVMTETIVTETAPLLRFLAILHVGLAIGVSMLIVGLLLQG